MLKPTLVEQFQHILKMQHWKYEQSPFRPQNPKHSMEAVTNLRRHHTAIRTIPDAEIDEKELLHEMIHPILEPIRAEHNLQLVFSATEGREDEFKERMLNEVEKAVDHLTEVIYSLYKALEPQ